MAYSSTGSDDMRYVTVTGPILRPGRPALFSATQAPSGHGALGYTADEALRRVLPEHAIAPGDWDEDYRGPHGVTHSEWYAAEKRRGVFVGGSWL